MAIHDPRYAYTSPPTERGTRDRDVLTPNQRIVFFIANIVIVINWLVFSVVVGAIMYDSAHDAWQSDTHSTHADEPNWAGSYFPALAVTGLVAAVLIGLVALFKLRLRHYVLESTRGI